VTGVDGGDSHITGADESFENCDAATMLAKKVNCQHQNGTVRRNIGGA
jgi:hypothetical protein